MSNNNYSGINNLGSNLPSFRTSQQYSNGEYTTNTVDTVDNGPNAAPNYQEETKQFAMQSIDELSDGDRVTIEVKKGNKSKKIDLYKGTTQVTTEKETITTTTYSYLSGWKGFFLLGLFTVPWMVGVDRLTRQGWSFLNKSFTK